MEWIRRSRMEDDETLVLLAEEVKHSNNSTIISTTNRHTQSTGALQSHRKQKQNHRNHHQHLQQWDNDKKNHSSNGNSKISSSSSSGRMKTKKPTCCSSSSSSPPSRLLFRILFGISLLLNILIIGPLLLLSTPKIALMSDGVSIQMSHKQIENLLQPQQQSGSDGKSTTVNGFVIQSPTFSQAIGAQELNRYGKSCIFVPQTNSWKCQNCGDGLNLTGIEEQNCENLPRVRNKCTKPMYRNPWDSPPRTYSSYDPTVVDDVEMRTIRELSYSHTMYLKQPLCTIEQCFDLTKCNSTVLTIYTNVSTSTRTTTTNTSNKSTTINSVELLLDYTVQHSAKTGIKLHLVDHPSEACISVIFPDTYKTAQEMYSAEHWNLYDNSNVRRKSQQPRRGGGRNNILWDMGNFKNEMSSWTGDHPFQQFHVAYAAVASQSINSPLVRHKYDMVLPLRRKWPRRVSSGEVDIHRTRRWLLSFRGDIQHKGIPYYNHRWLASEYWETSDDILIDVQCRYNKNTYKPYDHPASIYNEMMWNSTFGFCPGGAGVSSYRLGEYMSTGTIPVVVGDIVPPLGGSVDDGMDWSNCWIQIAESRIVDLPRILRCISPQEIHQRQKRCWQLHQMIWGELYDNTKRGWIDNPAVAFAKGMEIWSVRVANALESQQRAKQILDPPSSS